MEKEFERKNGVVRDENVEKIINKVVEIIPKGMTFHILMKYPFGKDNKLIRRFYCDDKIDLFHFLEKEKNVTIKSTDKFGSYFGENTLIYCLESYLIDLFDIIMCNAKTLHQNLFFIIDTIPSTICYNDVYRNTEKFRCAVFKDILDKFTIIKLDFLHDLCFLKTSLDKDTLDIIDQKPIHKCFEVEVKKVFLINS
uniref:Uncharacterized protein n=1 Tax=viral metagenome TaxID=1070528 RepID=A0A6C0JTE9_9ZZZZ